ncbi:hypothetical protein EVAR_79356_1 [Eumeta japonica]|uniref:Uncharacterized protein n=1 Tax=Eumeta variegata TaxID=151549 RepID=A0A4C1TFZ5_EUMVA|nr:hypothetical protein EVAR_79356_1 [Eumeta japonica]
MGWIELMIEGEGRVLNIWPGGWERSAGPRRSSRRAAAGRGGRGRGRGYDVAETKRVRIDSVHSDASRILRVEESEPPRPLNDYNLDLVADSSSSDLVNGIAIASKAPWEPPPQWADGNGSREFRVTAPRPCRVTPDRSGSGWYRTRSHESGMRFGARPGRGPGGGVDARVGAAAAQLQSRPINCDGAVNALRNYAAGVHGRSPPVAC